MPFEFTVFSGYPIKAFGYDRGTFGHKIGKDHVSNCFSSVIPDVCHRESMPFEFTVFSGYPIKAFGYDRGTFGHKIGKDHVSNCFSSVIPDVCHRESMPFESIVFSGYPIKTFGYDRGGGSGMTGGPSGTKSGRITSATVFRLSFPTVVIGNPCLLNSLFFLDTR